MSAPITSLARLATGMLPLAHEGNIKLYNQFPNITPIPRAPWLSQDNARWLSEYRSSDVTGEIDWFHRNTDHRELDNLFNQPVQNDDGTWSNLEQLGSEKGPGHSRLSATMRSQTGGGGWKYYHFRLGTHPSNRYGTAPDILAWAGFQGVVMDGDGTGDRMITSASFFVGRYSDLLAKLFDNGGHYIAYPEQPTPGESQAIIMEMMAREVFIQNYREDPRGGRGRISDRDVVVHTRSDGVVEAYHRRGGYGRVEIARLSSSRERDPWLLVNVSNVRNFGRGWRAHFWRRGPVPLYGKVAEIAKERGRDSGHRDVEREGTNPHTLYRYANERIAGLVGLPT